MEMLLQVRSFAPTIYTKILGVYKSSLQLRELITELLDFRKQEQGYMTIKVSEHNIVDFIYENYLLFQEYAVQRKITFRFQKTNDIINVWYDAKQLQKVMNNLLSNAFKYTKEEGEISVSVRKATGKSSLKLPIMEQVFLHRILTRYSTASIKRNKWILPSMPEQVLVWLLPKVL